MKNNKNTTVEHDIPSNDGQNDGIATQQAVRPVMQGELLTLPDMGPTGRPIKTSANLCALIRFQAWYPRYNLMTGEAELDNADGERLGGSEAGQRSALVDACTLCVTGSNVGHRGTGYRASMRRLRPSMPLILPMRVRAACMAGWVRCCAVSPTLALETRACAGGGAILPKIRMG